MKRFEVTVRYLFVVASMLALEGCGKESSVECPAGSEGCPCFNFTCDQGLICAGDVCQSITAGSGGGTTTAEGSSSGDPATTSGDPSTTDSGDPSTTDSGDPSTTDSGDPSTTDSGDPSTTDSGDPSTTDSGDPSTTDSGGDGDDPCDSFLGCVDVPSGIIMCDFWAQDCPLGEKCTAVASTPGSGSWDANICVPVGTEPPGSPCTAVDGQDGVDTCDGDGMCFDIDDTTGGGTCIEFCQGSPSNPTCPITNNPCKQLNNGVLNLCLPGCNPLNAGECPVGEVCVAAYEGDTLGGFICFPPASEGITGESCECANCCAYGHLCTDSATYGVDCAYDLCCTEFCSVSGGGVCAGTGQVCVAAFDANDPFYADVGICRVP